jgi:hypothetical protein
MVVMYARREGGNQVLVLWYSILFYGILWGMKLSDYAKQVGVTDKTAWQWWTAGHLEADPLPTGTLMVREPQTAACSVALDARVSSAEQQEDAVRPLQRLWASAAPCGDLWASAAPCGDLWRPAATCGDLRRPAATWGDLRRPVAT